ncbi:MAG TPA: SH3 domain-containing protein [Anaerolineales bacterium]|nr:SH3 domain-containing protein [Anaerolineales bacterium]
METLRKVWQALFTLPIFFSAVGVACLLILLGFAASGVFSPQDSSGLPTAPITIVPGATSTPYVPTPTVTRVPTSTSNIPPSPMPGMIGVGSSVQIFGTEGSGLNIRSEPGLGTEVRFVALDSEVFTVQAGPEVVDDFTWWYLVTPLDAARTGWAASNYLSLVAPEN